MSLTCPDGCLSFTRGLPDCFDLQVVDEIGPFTHENILDMSS